VPPPGHVLGAHGLLDAVHLLLVALAVARRVLLGLLQALSSGENVTLLKLNTASARPSPLRQRFSSFSSHVMVLRRVLFFSFSLSYFFFHCSAVSSTLTHTVFLMVFALKPRRTLLATGSLGTSRQSIMQTD
uniref:Uncharacterized protein n=1 Tax=Paramormyrops kingsleyae TaxID=1676925 RepID=A0A3B3SK69_9TELE